MICIFCKKKNEAKSVEHIVSESFGNKHYLLPKGAVCDECNNRFAEFEGKALSNSIFVMERSRLGVATKKGKNAKGKIGELDVAGSTDFEPQKLTLKGLSEKNFSMIDPKTLTGHLYVKTFDKSEVATSKLLLKIALESIYHSQSELYHKYNFKDLEDYLTNKSNTDWPFMTTSTVIGKFVSIPRFHDRYELKRIKCFLEYNEFSEGVLLFRFTYGAITMVINLINRDGKWISEYSANDVKSRVYPEHYRKKFGIENGKDDSENPLSAGIGV